MGQGKYVTWRGVGGVCGHQAHPPPPMEGFLPFGHHLSTVSGTHYNSLLLLDLHGYFILSHHDILLRMVSR